MTHRHNNLNSEPQRGTAARQHVSWPWRFGLLCGLASTGNLAAVTADGQLFEFAVAPQLIGPGARSLAMGGAFVSIADDATATTWNPAGLAQLEGIEFYASGGWYRSNIDGNSKDATEFDYAAVVLPFAIADIPQTFAISWRRSISLIGSQSTQSSELVLPDPADPFPLQAQIDSSSDKSIDGDLSQLSLSWAGYDDRLLPIHVGFTVSTWADDWTGNSAWDSYTDSTTLNDISLAIPPVPISIMRTQTDIVGQTEATVDKGFSIQLGTLIVLTEQFRLGLTYRPRSELDIITSGQRINTTQVLSSPGLPPTVTVGDQSGERSLSLPSSAALGLHWRIQDWTLLALDLRWTRWRELYVETDGERRSTLGSEVAINDIDDGYGVHLGFEHSLQLPQSILTFRTGAYVDERPGLIPNDNSDELEPEHDVYFGFAAGMSYAQRNWIADLGMGWDIGNGVGTNQNTDFRSSSDSTEIIARLGFTWFLTQEN